MPTNKKIYRKLTPAEIAALTAQGCCADDWSKVEVGEGFESVNICGVRFSGLVRIGACGSEFTDSCAVERTTGIYNAHIIDCTIGDNAFISNIGGYIARYDVGDGVVIEGVERVVCSAGGSDFGNGVEVRTVNEGGGREVAIYDGLSAQMAYMVAMYRHRSTMIERLHSIIGAHVENFRSKRGRICDGATVRGCGAITDVNVGKGSVVEGALVLTNGTLGEGSYIGAGVVASDFVCSAGSKVSGGSSIKRCFVGEACGLDSGFTAVDSLFFANSDLANGEAVSIFAAPYTVSHHKSSLLIAGYFSFFNAGSGANQSNHLFKSGAVHQGVHERGCKFASNAYIMLPAREGAFTVVIGRHTSHHDTQLFPYSYLVEQESKSYLHPGANLRSFGTQRDIAKWPQRDGRKGVADRINFEEHNPYIGEKLCSAIALSREMLAKDGVEVHSYQRVRIKSALLKRGVHLYQMALDAAIGAILSSGGSGRVEFSEHWVDMAGMYVPKRGVDAILDGIDSNKLTSIDDIEAAFSELYNNYGNHAYAWALGMLGDNAGAEEIAQTVEKGKKAQEELDQMRTEDGKKDNEGIMMTSYGVDAQEDAEADFRAVRSK